MIFNKLALLFNFTKVVLMCVAAFFIIFWFWQFFNLPLTDVIRPVLDIAVLPITIVLKLFKVENEAVLKFSYVILGILIFVLSWICAQIEKLFNACQLQTERRDIARRIEEEKKMNEELQKELTDDLLSYEYFSVYIKYQITYANEIIAQNNSCTIASAASRSYEETIEFIRKRFPELGIRLNKASVFIRGQGFDDIEKIITGVLGAIRQVKVHNAQDAINTKFQIVVDCQKDESESAKSCSKSEKIAQNGYYNKAIATTNFKLRFDLIRQNSKFETEPLGVAVSYETENPEELYIFRTKTITT